MLDFNAVREVGSIVKIGGPYFGSLAEVTAFYPEAEPTQIEFTITDPAVDSVHVGETGQDIAGQTEVVSPAYQGRHRA